MMDEMRDFNNSMADTVTGENRVDPGTFSFGQTGWFLFHAGAIAGVYLLGCSMARRHS